MVKKSVVGLDLSLTRTGMAMFTEGDPHADIGVVESRGKKDESWESRLSRMTGIVDRIESWVRENPRSVIDSGKITGIYVEGPSYGSTTGHQHDRSGLWWLVYARLSHIAPIYVIQPQTRAKYATGSGTASKDAVLAATVRQFLTVDVWCNDVADAVQLAAMGARDQCWPVDDNKSRASLDALEKIAQ